MWIHTHQCHSLTMIIPVFHYNISDNGQSDQKTSHISINISKAKSNSILRFVMTTLLVVDMVHDTTRAPVSLVSIQSLLATNWVSFINKCSSFTGDMTLYEKCFLLDNAVCAKCERLSHFSCLE
jgi:hypothetical protein